mmetsp:Transcript_60514/g.98005  ORF Transcript_60514/g.98005 Transcript_60514/m.98005 type:complete len:91 (-) Transcript_60514:586-858(-)
MVLSARIICVQQNPFAGAQTAMEGYELRYDYNNNDNHSNNNNDNNSNTCADHSLNAVGLPLGRKDSGDKSCGGKTSCFLRGGKACALSLL